MTVSDNRLNALEDENAIKKLADTICGDFCQKSGASLSLVKLLRILHSLIRYLSDVVVYCHSRIDR